MLKCYRQAFKVSTLSKHRISSVINVLGIKLKSLKISEEGFYDGGNTNTF